MTLVTGQADNVILKPHCVGSNQVLTIQYNTIQYNTIELYCPVNGKFGYSVRVKVNKKYNRDKKIRINKYIKNEHLNFYQHN